MENEIKLSSVLAMFCWASVILLTWVLVLERVKVSWLSGTAWIFFLMVAVISSAVQGKRNG